MLESLIETALPERAAIACSGGLDSMALLYAAQKVARGRSLFVFHVTHHMRSWEEGKADFDLVAGFCASVGIPLINHIVEPGLLSQGSNQEERARSLRYKAMARLAIHHNVDSILIAHHEEDGIETQLMHFFLGIAAGDFIPEERLYPSESGMVRFVRPWINVRHSEIVTYVDRFKIPYRHDSSNTDNRLLRNAIRNDILPRVRAHFPGLESALELLRLKQSDYREAIAYVIQGLDWHVSHGSEGSMCSVPYDAFSLLPAGLRIEAIKRACGLLTAEHYKAIPDYRALRNIDRFFSFPDNKSRHTASSGIRYSSGDFTFYRSKELFCIGTCIVGSEKKGYLMCLTATGEFAIPGAGIAILRERKPYPSGDVRGNMRQQQTVPVTELPLIVRTARDGETLRRKNTGDTERVSLREHLVRNGIPVSDLSRVPIIEFGSNPGYAWTVPWTGRLLLLGDNANAHAGQEIRFDFFLKEMEFPT